MGILSFQNVSAKYPNMMKNIMQGQQNRMMAPHMMGPSPKRPKLSNMPLPGAPVSLGGPRSASPGMGGPRGPMMGSRPMNPMGPGGPGGMMGPNGGPMGPRGPFSEDMNMGPMGPSGPMRPMGGGPGPDGDLGGASPGHLPVSSSCNSPQTSVPAGSLDSPSMTTTAPITTNSSGDPSLGFNDPSTPDPSRLDGAQSPSLQDSATLSGK